MAKLTSIRSLTEDEYKKLGNWSVGTLHRASTSQETAASSGAKSGEYPTDYDLAEQAQREWAKVHPTSKPPEPPSTKDK